MLHRCVVLAIPLLGLASCDQVFGLDRVRVEGTYVARTLGLDSNRAPVVSSTPYPTSEIDLRVRLDDGTEQEVPVDTSGAFSFPRADPDQRYTLTFRTGNTAVYQLAQPAVTIVELVPGPLDPADATAGTRLQMTLSNRALETAEEITSSGSWSRYGQPVANPIDVDWTTVSTAAGPVGLLVNAEVHYAGYLPSSTPAGTYLSLQHLATVPDVTMNAGVVTSLNADPVPVDRSSCMHVISEVMTEGQRMAAATPSSMLTGSTVFEIDAVPSSEFAAVAGFPLAVAGDLVPQPDSDWTGVMYGTPFLGHHTIAHVEADAVRFAGGAPFPMLSRLFVVPPADCTTPLQLRAGAVALLGQITLAGSLLATDGQRVDIDRSAEIPITWTPSAGAADYWRVTLFEVSGSAVLRRMSIVTPTPNLTLDPDLLTTNTLYALQVRTEIGTPNASHGDFATAAMPAGSTDVISTTFNVR